MKGPLELSLDNVIGAFTGDYPTHQGMIHNIEEAMQPYLFPIRFESRTRAEINQLINFWKNRVLERIVSKQGNDQITTLRTRGLTEKLIAYFPHMHRVYQQATERQKEIFRFNLCFSGIPHFDEMRGNGEDSYLMHMLGVANGVAKVSNNPFHIMSAYAHDNIERIMELLAKKKSGEPIDQDIDTLYLEPIIKNNGEGKKIFEHIGDVSAQEQIVIDLSAIILRGYKQELSKRLTSPLGEIERQELESNSRQLILLSQSLGDWTDDILRMTERDRRTGITKKENEQCLTTKSFDVLYNMNDTDHWLEQLRLIKLLKQEFKGFEILNTHQSYWRRGSGKLAELETTRNQWEASLHLSAGGYQTTKHILQTLRDHHDSPHYDAINNYFRGYLARGGILQITPPTATSYTTIGEHMFDGRVSLGRSIVNKKDNRFVKDWIEHMKPKGTGNSDRLAQAYATTLAFNTIFALHFACTSEMPVYGGNGGGNK